MALGKPVVVEVKENKGFVSTLKDEINKQASNDANLLLSYPSVYIHGWKKKNGNPTGLYDIYIGESNDVVQRTKEHMNDSKDSKKWQHHLVDDGATPTLYMVGHECFTKSMTLDIENRLICYALGMNSVSKVHNAKGNPQNEYFYSDKLDDVFNLIWRALRHKNKELFLAESQIRDSAVFKASPLHKLTEEQLTAKNKIIDKVFEAINENKKGQLIFVQGEAGTGKTVLMSSTFYDLLEKQKELFEMDLKCALLVNHDEQLVVYNEIARKLGLFDAYKGNICVSKPTSFINEYRNRKDYPFDVVFIDEGHLLLTRGKQAYTGKNQLEDIMKISKVTVLVFDENQILTAEEYWEEQQLAEKKQLSENQNNFIHLENQLRMQCNQGTLKFINDITLNQTISPWSGDQNYEIKVCNSPDELKRIIEAKSKEKDSELSRILATYDWDYNNKKAPTNGEKYWGVRINKFFMPWNRELTKHLSRKEKRNNKNLAWAEQKETIDEVGSTFTIQGFDLSYAGVIIGPSVIYRNGKIMFDPSKSKNTKATQKRTLSNNQKKQFGETLLKHELRVLLTRGVKGLFIYACDKELNDALKKATEISK